MLLCAYVHLRGDGGWEVLENGAMTVVAFLNQKGGTGKTTLSLNAAFGLAQAGERVLLVDADRQASVNAWSALREDQPFSVVAVPRKNLHREIARQKEFYDWVVIDGTPRDDAITRSCLIAADVAVIPIEPSALSAWASDRTVGQIEEARIYRPDLRAFFVVSRKIAGTVLGREMRRLELPLPVLETEITQRVAFAESMLKAQSHPGVCAGECGGAGD